VTDRKPYRHRFPLSIIQYALWLYHHFSLSQRDVQELLQERGIQVSHETLRQWNIKFAPSSPKNSGTGNPVGVPGGSWMRSASRLGVRNSGYGEPSRTLAQSSTSCYKLGETSRQRRLFLDDC